MEREQAVLVMSVETAWMVDALCREVDSDLFFPDRGSVPTEAKRVCARCPVLAQCRDFAATHPVMGVWGGLTGEERKRMGLPTFPLRVEIESVCKSEAGYTRHLRRGEEPCADCYVAMQFVNAERELRSARSRRRAS